MTETSGRNTSSRAWADFAPDEPVARDPHLYQTDEVEWTTDSLKRCIAEDERILGELRPALQDPRLADPESQRLGRLIEEDLEVKRGLLQALDRPACAASADAWASRGARRT